MNCIADDGADAAVDRTLMHRSCSIAIAVLAPAGSKRHQGGERRSGALRRPIHAMVFDGNSPLYRVNRSRWSMLC
jgi:hypothetical protein